jgi:hypothetical protein
MTGYVNRLTRRVPLVEQELLTLPEHLSSPPVFSGVRVTRSLVLYVCFVDRCLSFCTFSFGQLCCLFVFDIRILIVPLVSSNSSSMYIIYLYTYWGWIYIIQISLYNFWSYEWAVVDACTHLCLKVLSVTVADCLFLLRPPPTKLTVI